MSGCSPRSTRRDPTRLEGRRPGTVPRSVPGHGRAAVAGHVRRVTVCLDERRARIHRCPDCQIAVFSEYGRPEVLFVRAGTLDDPDSVAPDVHIYTRSKVPWVELPESVPAFDAYYDTKALWPAESYARVRAALSRA